MSDPDRFSRREAAAHLQSLGYRIAPQTLANRQVKGTGPEWHPTGWRSGYYEREALEAWAEANCPKAP